MNTNYNMSTTLDCCQNKCDTTKESDVDKADCRQGCSIWLRHSSLNWESTKWWPQLKERCILDCGQPQSWRLGQHDPEVQTYWHNQPVPEDESICKAGCGHYY